MKKISLLALAIVLTQLFSFGFSSDTFAYKKASYSWPTTPVPYYINNVFATSFQTAMKASDATWDGAPADFNFSYAGTTSRNQNTYVNYTRDNYNGIGYTNAGNGSLARTKVFSSGSVILETDTTFNTYFLFTTVDAPGRYDVQSVMTHEFGHWLTLLDLTDPNSPSYCESPSRSTMCSNMIAGDKYFRTLETDDKNGIKSIYGT